MAMERIALMLATLLGAAAGQDVGFELLFKSQLDEFSSHCVKAPGHIPAWALGDFIIPGTGQFEMGDRHFVDTLDAFGKIHRFELREGEVCATYRMMASGFYNESKKENTIAAGLLFWETVPPRHCPFYDPICNVFAPNDNTFVNTIKHSGKLLALTDGPKLLEIDPESMAVLGTYKFEDNLQGKICYASSAHPLNHPKTGDWIDFVGNANPLTGTSIRLFNLSEADPHNRRSLADIHMDTSPYMHSFGMTEKYVVLPRMPIKLDAMAVVRKPLSEAFEELDLSKVGPGGNAFHVVPLDGTATKVRKLPSDQRLYYTHTVNTYENGTGIVIDLCTQTHNFFSEGLKIEALSDKATRDKTSSRPVVKRFLLPFADDVPVTTEVISDPGVWTDFTKMNPRYRSRKHCFYWGVQFFTDGKTFGYQSISKYDLCHGGAKRQWSRPNWFPSEASFVPSADEHAAEDDGVLLFTALDGIKEQTYLMVVNASTMESISEIGPFPRIGFTTHGEFYTGGQPPSTPAAPTAAALEIVV